MPDEEVTMPAGVRMPDGVQREIMLNIPAEFLIQLKTVSRLWYDTLSCPNFPLPHFSKSRHTSLLLMGDGALTFHTSPLHLLSTPPVDIEFPDIDPAEEDRDLEFDMMIYGHSHGIICVTDEADDMHVWNPITTQVTKLPPSSLLEGTIIDAMGFGYDRVAKDLKAVRVLRNYLNDSFRAEVFELRSQAWREISCLGFEKVLSRPCMEMHHNGKYYWLATQFVGAVEEPRPMFLLSFAFTEEVFGRIPFPPGLNSINHTHDDTCLRTGLLDDSLILIHYPTKYCELQDGSTFEVWKMDNDHTGVWTILFTIHPILDMAYPLLLLSENELLMESNEGTVVVCYLNTKEVKQILSIQNPQVSCTAIMFEPSLFSTTGTAEF